MMTLANFEVEGATLTQIGCCESAVMNEIIEIRQVTSPEIGITILELQMKLCGYLARCTVRKTRPGS